jgi:hypothetical protein
MDIEGRVRIELGWDGEAVRKVRVASNRVDISQPLLGGRSADEAETLLPRVFSICARAQGAAAAAALCAARGIELCQVQHHQMAVVAETAVEYLWRFLIDLPGLFGLPQHHELVGRLRRELSEVSPPPSPSLERREELGCGDGWLPFIGALRRAASDECFGGDTGELADPEAFINWEAHSHARLATLLRAIKRAALGSPDAALLPSASEGLLREIGAALGADSAFSRRPEHAGMPAECGARSRLAGHPLLEAAKRQHENAAYQRVLARIVELAGIPERLQRLIDGESDPGWVHGLALEPGRGIAAVETARGLLVHWANVEDDRVAGYRIVAPTEWNFHPCGALVKDLADAPAQSSEEAQQLAGVAIQSLDPCVRFELRLTRL